MNTAIEKKANNYAYLVVFIITIIFVLVAAGFAANGAAKLSKNPAYNSDSNLKKARTYLIVSAVLGIVIGVFMIIGTFMFSAAALTFILAILIFSLILAIIIGVLCFLAGTTMKKSSAYSGQGQDKTAYNSALIAGGLAIGAVVFVIIAMFIYGGAKKKAKERLTAAAPPPVAGAAGAAGAVVTPAGVAIPGLTAAQTAQVQQYLVSALASRGRS